MRVGARLELELVDPSKNARRRYALAVTLDPQLALFADAPAGYVLVRAWGRLEGLPTVKRDRFEDLEQLRAAWQRHLATRRRHGYVEVGPARGQSAPAHGPTSA